MKKLTHILLLVFFFSACEEGQENFTVVDNYIEEDLQEYFESFKQEAAKYNIEIDYEDLRIDGYIRNIRERGVAGQCQTFEGGLNAVVISSAYWNTIEGLQREFLVYHELGHCALDREHLDESDENGLCKSIMYSGGNVCNLNYNRRTKEEYLSELFTNL